MDLSDTIAPTSDQLDAVDLLGGARVFTITEVSKGSAEQPVNIKLAEFPRVWRPGKSMRRVLVAVWGPKGADYVGRRVELYCEPNVKFGGEAVGGTRIRRMSHITKRQSVPLIVSRGKSAMWTVDPLPDEPVMPTHPTPEEVAACTDRDRLLAWYQAATGPLKVQIKARGEALKAAAEAVDPPPELVPDDAA